MMRNILLSQLACIMFTVLIYFPCHAQEISSAELIKDAKQYDGKSVTYRGEVVGDIMIRGEHAWLSVNDGSNAIGVWINRELIKNIQYVGGYRTKGDMVEIAGIFKRGCPEHGGDLDIHAQSINKISSGSKITHAVNIRAIKFAFVLFCMVLLVFFLKVWRARRSAFSPNFK